MKIFRSVKAYYRFPPVLIIGVLVLFTSSCEKEKMPLKKAVYTYITDSVTDINGNVYKTVLIGDQWWMAENLKVRTYRDNTPLYFTASYTNSIWAELKTGGYCNLYDLSVSHNGYLYNWYAVNNAAGLAPEGWRIPSDEDWKKLELFIGMHPDMVNMTGWRGTDEGEKLKIHKSDGIEWRIDRSIDNNNQSGFSASPGGCRIYDGSFGDADKYSTGFWWSSTTPVPEQAFYRYLDYRYGGVFRYHALFSSGFSVRCVKDAGK